MEISARKEGQLGIGLASSSLLYNLWEFKEFVRSLKQYLPI